MSSARDDDQAAERVVIRDKRKIDPSGGKATEAETAASDKTDEAPAEATKDTAAADGAAEKERKPSHAAPEPDEEASTAAKPAADKAEPTGVGAPLGAELEALRGELEERTRDLQRVTAEYANYRKRVDRDRGVQAEQSTGLVITALLPVLDDLDRAREHGDLVGPFAAVAEQLVAALGKFGLSAFGEKGDPFDPTRHEAVAHRTSSDVTEPTCVEVMRRGYLLSDRLLRAALVAVADPE
ncbi:nucleotide exchange factor GrpE [Phytohabitans flavus]|uniref:Protein GrpE n=1 Tax=Phytohabitans flavus TaxID=1076124 RepID=A0A6F8Y3E3_9ACTN|nr:nucleotide exchange factor GrpE [Phytohabitans flavus]BCB80491.1 protein GrpE [Phytohabitans flavus]